MGLPAVAPRRRWLRVQMSLIGSTVIGAVVGVLLSQSAQLTAGDVGLTLQFASQFVQLVQNVFRSKTMLEVQMNDVERVDEYASQLPLEAYSGAAPPAAWPRDGAVRFKDVRLQYATAAAPIFPRPRTTIFGWAMTRRRRRARGAAAELEIVLR